MFWVLVFLTCIKDDVKSCMVHIKSFPTEQECLKENSAYVISGICIKNHATILPSSSPYHGYPFKKLEGAVEIKEVKKAKKKK